jgi:phosphatidylserine decarboxylase
MFKIGGSAVALFGASGNWRPSDDILENTSRGVETFIRLGDAIAHRLA